MSNTEIWWAGITAVATALSLVMTAVNAWSRVQMRNEILQLRVYMSDHYVSKTSLDEAVQRLERLLDRLERRLDGRGGNLS